MTMSILVAGIVVLAESTMGRWPQFFRFAAIFLAAGVVAECGWAALEPHSSSPWLYRTILLMMSFALMTLVSGVGLPRLPHIPPAWSDAGRRLGPVLGGLASLLLLVVLLEEGLLFDLKTSRTPMALPAIAVVTAALVAMIAAGIYFAVVPGRDPFGLTLQGRKFYVYAAEVLLLFLFIHARLAIPELFGGKLGKYWTIIVMIVAYVGVGLGEFFVRRGLHVLAEPLQRTGIFLPALPLISFWVRPPAALNVFAAERFPGLRPMLDYLERLEFRFDKYALLWFLLCGLYSLIAFNKRSFRFAIVAALAANFGLWSLLFYGNLSFLIHPQMWLIPFAVIVLVAEHVNRDRLSVPQSTTLRYLALMVIYVSSTADMFIAGMDESITWPLVLALLSVLGVLAGILVQVRAFLYLGVTFLFVVIFRMIWYAAVGRHQIWVWWASVIVLGAAIITLFAIFEKRRNDVLRMLERIKRWD
jgi:hypothetical protein